MVSWSRPNQAKPLTPPRSAQGDLRAPCARPTASIIIPAHNEGAVIGRCLQSLLQSAKLGEFEIVVVCNGCEDNTANIARKYQVRVLETETPSKANALNLGDSASSVFPRFYVDADVVLKAGDLRKLISQLELGRLAVSPRPHYELRACHWLVRQFYRVWLEHPALQDGLVGCGVYGLSHEGRKRFGRFPNITADDGFVRSLFRPGERKSISTASVLVSAPRILSDLIKIKARSRRGNRELKKLSKKSASRSRQKFGLRLLRMPRLWPFLPAYLLVTILAQHQACSRNSPRWERDESSRQGL